MRKPRAAIALALLALTLTACNGGDDPTDPMSTWTPSGTIEVPSSSTPTVDPLTEAPKGETARQFIRRWVALINHTQATGDTAAYLAISGRDCRSCEQFADSVKEVYEAGGYIRSEGSKVADISHNGGSQWTVRLVAPPSDVKESEDANVRHLAGGPYSYTVYVSRLDSGWSMSSYVGHTP